MNNYDPPIGSNRHIVYNEDLIPPEYDADLDGLRNLLETLLFEVRQFEGELESTMFVRHLIIDKDDKRLIESHNKEWPRNLGEPGDTVSYRYYKALRLRNTTSASYVRKRYEEAARDVAGTSALDFLSLTSITKDEALLIQEFLNAHIGSVDDSSEHRTIELFEDWVHKALWDTRQFRSFFQAGESATELLSDSEVSNTSPEEAKQGQAVFKVKLNSLNGEVVKNVEFLRDNFSEFAPVFYKKYLGPALNFRLNVGRQVLPTASRVSKEVSQASGVLDHNLRKILADQERRRMIFTKKTEQIFNDVRERDKYRTWIIQLGLRGVAVPTSGANTMKDGSESAAEVEYFDRLEQEAREEEAEEEPFTPYHSSLEGLEDLDAHPQYLIRSGDNFEGDMTMEEGTLLDGMRPSTHRHTGKDGTPQIHGSDIIGGTISDDAVDTGNPPPGVTGLRVVGHEVITNPPGSSTVNTTIRWDGDNSGKYTYEVTFARMFTGVTWL